MDFNKEYKYYDKEWFRKILYLVEQRRFSEVLKIYQDYIEKYPYDVSAITSYASMLINFGYLDEAEEVINNITHTKNSTKDDRIQEKLVTIRLLGCRNEFEKCYELLKENAEEISKIRSDYNFTLLFLQKKLNLPIDFDITTCPYIMKQALNYDEKLALEYIKEFNTTGNNKPVFINTFPIDEYYHSFQQMLPIANYRKIFKQLFRNIYIFKYDHNGIFAGKPLDYIKVVTLQDTNEILSIYTTDNAEGYPYIDINPKVEEIETNHKMIKRMSQIEKFNQKYYKN